MKERRRLSLKGKENVQSGEKKSEWELKTAEVEGRRKEGVR